MTTPAIDIAVGPGALLGECPVWEPDEARLWWIDITGRAIHRYDPSTGRDESLALASRPGSITRTARPGTWLVATEHQLAWFEWDGVARPWLDLEPAGTGVRLNDGRTDPGGRFVVGSMHEDERAARKVGNLHIVHTDRVDTVRSGVGVANGLAFDADRRCMYFADSTARMVWRYPYEADTGVAGSPVPFVDFAEYPGFPDGACVDVDGCYWIAAVYGSALLRITPDGRLDRSVELPIRKPTMPAFGGPDLSTLFVTSMGGDRGERPGAPAGAVLAIDAGVGGRVDPPLAWAPAP